MARPQLRSRSSGSPRRSGSRPFTVGEVLGQVRACLEDNFLPVHVRGEVRDLRQPRSGHLYLSLHDPSARLRVVVFSSTLQGIPHRLEAGALVSFWGRISAYPASGDVQLIADWFEPDGQGDQWVRRERLRKALQQEGLFAPARKQRLPRVPRTVGVVTSPSGSAIHDVVTTVRRRLPSARIVLRPVQVNGAAAGPDIARAIADLDARGGADVLIVVRGGGAQEDLACFDHEAVVRAIAAARTPVVTGVGHEDDVTLADLVADRRGPTPTGAAELAVPVQRELEAALERAGRRLVAAARARVAEARRRLTLAERAHGLQAPAARLARWRDRLVSCEARLARLHPAAGLRAQGELLDELEARLTRAAQATLGAEGRRLAAAAQRLEALSPLRVLARGYSLTTTEDGRLVQRAGDVAPGDVVETRLARGRIRARVEACLDDEAPPA